MSIFKRSPLLDQTRCVDGRRWRHDPQPDDPYLETDVGQCPECEGKGCDTHSTVWVCQGPPRCGLEGDDAVAAQQAGCAFCKQIRIADDGTELTIEPGNA